MSYRFKQIALFLILIAVIGLGLNQVFGVNTTPYISTYTTKTGIILYKYNFRSYFMNIKTNITAITDLKIEPPEGNWATTGDPLNLNNLTYIFNWFLYGLNWFLYPIRIGGYVVSNILAILGLNVQISNNPITWLIKLVQIGRDLQIPYVNV